MWGGTPDRNMVSNMKGLPTEWDVKTKKNVKWVADLGSQSYGNPVVAGGMVFVGTNNELLRDPKQPRRSRRADGVPRVRRRVPVAADARRSSSPGRANDWPFQGVASSPLVEGDQLYYVSNRGVRVLPRHPGLPRQRERRPGHRREAHRPDRRRRHLVVRHDGGGRLLSAQPGELVAGHLGRPDLRRAPRTARTRATSTSRRRARRRSSRSTRPPASWCGRTTRSRTASCTASGRRRRSARSAACVQVVSAQGDGWVRGYEAQTGKKLWEFDTNPEGRGLAAHAQRADRHAGDLSRTASTSPTARIPEHGEGVGHFYAIDATKRGDITQSGPRLALRQDPPLDLDGGDRRRPRLHRRLQRLPPLPRRQDRPGVLDARRLRRRLGLAVRRRRQGLPRRRRRRRRRPGSTARRRRCWPR